MPYSAEISVFWRPILQSSPDEGEVELRVVLATAGERAMVGGLEEREGLERLFHSGELEVREREALKIGLEGNLRVVGHQQGPGRQGGLLFRPFSENRASFRVSRMEGGLPAAGKLELRMGLG